MLNQVYDAFGKIDVLVNNAAYVAPIHQVSQSHLLLGSFGRFYQNIHFHEKIPFMYGVRKPFLCLLLPVYLSSKSIISS